ncbi:MAG: EF-hand domain-containing protein [Novosphingobium sp.]|nr:EF-hand domain-containing protein [Novosphingobium sp.]
MKKLTIGLSVAALALAGAAYAQPGMHARPDTNGDGVVTRAEAQAHADQMFARMDVNSDGKLDQADGEARRAARFDRMDADGNGQISRTEFEAKPQWRKGGGDGKRGGWGHKRGHRGGKMMMRMADTNGDGAVSKAEFTAAALKHFDKADANNDGKVTQEEHEAARAAMRDQWRQKMGGGQGPGAPGS